jgi:hypothetical protein
LNAAYPRLQDRAEVLAIDIDDAAGVVAAFTKKNRYAFPVLRLDRSVEPDYTAALSLQGPNIPQLYVFDREGNIRFRITGFDEDGILEEKLNWMISAAAKQEQSSARDFFRAGN